MNKLEELFISSVNTALIEAGVITDKYQKSIAYSTAAQAIATYLNKNTDSAMEVPAPVKPQSNNIKEDTLRLSENNLKIKEAIDKAIENMNDWKLPYDDNGIPFLDEADFANPERVLAYENALTPEIVAKKREIEIAQGNAVLNEAPAPVAPAPVAQVPTQEAPAVFEQADLDQLQQYKVNFGYEQDATQLNTLLHNFSEGVLSDVEALTPQTIKPFLLFIQTELTKGYAKLEEWKNSWITKAGLDSLISGAYQVEGATIESYVHDGNLFWFNSYVELYNANAWLASYRNDIAAEQLNSYAKTYLDDFSTTVDSINDENVIGFIYFVQETMAQSA